jgi:hypothetical protein
VNDCFPSSQGGSPSKRKNIPEEVPPIKKSRAKKKLSRSASEAILVRRKKTQEACQVVIQKASQVVPSNMGTTGKKAGAVIHHPSFKAHNFFQRLSQTRLRQLTSPKFLGS